MCLGFAAISGSQIPVGFSRACQVNLSSDQFRNRLSAYDFCSLEHREPYFSARGRNSLCDPHRMRDGPCNEPETIHSPLWFAWKRDDQGVVNDGAHTPG